MGALLEVRYCITKSVGLLRKSYAVSLIYNERVRLGASSSSNGALDVDLDSSIENSPVSHDRHFYRGILCKAALCNAKADMDISWQNATTKFSGLIVFLISCYFPVYIEIITRWQVAGSVQVICTNVALAYLDSIIPYIPKAIHLQRHQPESAKSTLDIVPKWKVPSPNAWRLGRRCGYYIWIYPII